MVTALLGSSTAFIEATLAQIYKERQSKKGFKYQRDEELERQFDDNDQFHNKNVQQNLQFWQIRKILFPFSKINTLAFIHIVSTNTMKTMKNCEKMEIFPLILKIGDDSVFDLCEKMVVDEPIKIGNECKILRKSREGLSWNREGLFLDFEDMSFGDVQILSNTAESLNLEN